MSSECWLMFLAVRCINCLNKETNEMYLWHVGEPLQNGIDTFKVITYSAVGHSIVMHDLDATQLVIRSIHLSSKHLCKGRAQEKEHYQIFLRHPMSFKMLFFVPSLYSKPTKWLMQPALEKYIHEEKTDNCMQ